MRKCILFVLCLTGLYAGGQEFRNLGPFPLASGVDLPDCRVGFRRFGTVNSDSSNIIVVPTWFSGKSIHLTALIGPDKMLDSTRYHIIVIDALGNGVSTSPSNSPNAPFPDITISDMVESQYILLKRELGISHVLALLGGSMGGMQAFQWWAMYPDYMDKVISYVGTPWPTTYSRLVWESETRSIRDGLRYNLPDSTITRSVAEIQILNAYTPTYRNRHTPEEAADSFFRDYLKKFKINYHHYDWLCQLQAMMTHDIRPWLEPDRNRPPLLCIVSRTDHLVPPENTIAFAEENQLPLLILDNDCGHLAPGCEMARFVRAVESFLENNTVTRFQ